MVQESWKDAFRDAASENIEPIDTQILGLPPSCVEFVPFQKQENSDYFVVGTYNLQKEEVQEVSTATNETNTAPKAQTRDGSLILFRAGTELSLVETQSYPSAILDLHFCPANTQTPIFAVASSTGTISIYDVRRSSGSFQMNQIGTHQIMEPDILILSLSWHPGLVKEVCLPLMMVSTSRGGIYLVQFTGWDFEAYRILNDEGPLLEHTFMGSPIEAWTCIFAGALGNRLACYSGGDDSTLRATNLKMLSLSGRTILGVEEDHSQMHKHGRNSGVTAILPLGKDLLVTGSYDEHIRLFDASDLSAGPKALLRVEGGGIWRLKYLNSESTLSGTIYRILASCMHAGARIIELEEDTAQVASSFRFIARVTIHKSMNYASDVAPIYDNGQLQRESLRDVERPPIKRLIVSTSFYDKLLCTWTFNPTMGADAR